jgi:hypothetical protein
MGMPPDTAPPETIALAIGISLAVGIFVIGISSWLFRREGTKWNFWDIIRDSAGYPSLARFQFLIWTIVILFSLLSINILRLHPINQNPPEFSFQPGLLALMGISVAVTPTSAYVAKLKYGEHSGKTLESQDLMEERKKKPFGLMLLQNGRPSLTRFQMFSWTIISVLLYCAQLFITYLGPLSELVLPDVDPVMVMLMGLSQAAYIGGKWSSTPSMSITKVYPVKNLQPGEIVTITGINFGTEESSVEMTTKKDDTSREQRIAKDDMKWDDTKIEITLKESIDEITEIKVNVGSREAIWKAN